MKTSLKCQTFTGGYHKSRVVSQMQLKNFPLFNRSQYFEEMETILKTTNSAFKALVYRYKYKKVKKAREKISKFWRASNLDFQLVMVLWLMAPMYITHQKQDALKAPSTIRYFSSAVQIPDHSVRSHWILTQPRACLSKHGSVCSEYTIFYCRN